jgi:hypothetical protein
MYRNTSSAVQRSIGGYVGALALTALSTLSACGGGGGSSDNNGSGNAPAGITTTGPGVLSVSPLELGTLVYATPLGNLAPPGHVLPTDHVYLYFVDPWGGQVLNANCAARPVYAAGSGVVTFILQTEAAGDTKIMVQMTKTFMYYYDHILVLPSIKVGSRVNAGDQIATTTGRCPSIDLGVYDLDVNLPGYVNPTRYGDFGAHPVSPYKYFSEPLRSTYYSRIRILEGVPANKDGRVDWGVRGRLVGDWFHSSIANAPSSTVTSAEGWSKSLSFTYEWFNAAPRISIGGTIAPPALFSVPAGALDFNAVTVASGLVAYQATSAQGTAVAGWVLVQMLTDDRIKVEYFANATSAPVAFTSAAQEYVR